MAKDPFDIVMSSLDGCPDASILDQSPLSLVDSWIDTGSYALNAILSGSLYGGLPYGRICGFSGPSGCGKTLMLLKTVGNFLRADPENRAVVFDSEIAVDAQTATALGCDASRIKHVPIGTVLDVRNACLKLLNSIIENNLQGKFIVIVDSLGNLAASKEIDDAEKGKDASDMGLRAKQIKSLLRVLTYRAASAKTTILFSNHEYSDPMAMYPSLVKNQSGGEGPVYMASLLVQLSFKREKNEKDFEDQAIIAAAKRVGGITMHALTTKNRFIPQMLTTDLYLNFKTGLDKYSGLFDLAKGLNVIQGDNTYTFGDKKLGFRKGFERDADVWENLLIKPLDAAVQKEFKFSSAADEIKKDIK
jgi:RecA/RadA recombinase